MACELARYGVPFRLVEQRPGPSTTSKALAVFPRTLETFEIMGMISSVLEKGHRLDGLSLSNGETSLGELTFAELPSRYRCVISLPQSDTEGLLIEHLTRLGGKVEWSTTLMGLSQDGDRVRATLRGPSGAEESTEVPWLIGCDGAHSAVRHALDLKFAGEQYDQSFLLADVKLDPPIEENRAHAFLSEEGLFAFFPFGDGRFRIVAQVELPPKEAGDLPPPDLSEITQLVRQRSPVTSEISDVTWSSRFRISARKIAQFRHGHVFLCGDAAHIHSPAGGQGMNTGIQDAFNLAWKLAYFTKGLSRDRLLDTYHDEREPVAQGVLHLTDRLTHFATTHSTVLQQVRNFILPVVVGIGAVRHRMVERLAELTIAYPQSSMVTGRYGHFHGGDRMPDVEFAATDGSPLRLYEILAAERRPLLLVNEGASPVPTLRTWNLPDHFAKLVVVRLVATEAGASGALSMLLDAKREFHDAVGTEKAGLILIRPDGYVGLACGDLDFRKLEVYLERLYEVG